MATGITLTWYCFFKKLHTRINDARYSQRGELIVSSHERVEMIRISQERVMIGSSHERVEMIGSLHESVEVI